MLIRKAKADDHLTITSFQLAMARETENIELVPEIVSAGVKAVLENPEKGQYYVAEINGTIAGSLLTTYEWSDWRNGTILWIQSVYVMPEFRRKGVYRNLYAHIKDMVQKSNNLNGIRLYADKANTTAHKTYQKLGMTPDHYLTFEWLK